MELQVEKFDVWIGLLLSSHEWCKNKVGEMGKPQLCSPVSQEALAAGSQCICHLGTILLSGYKLHTP